MEVRNESKSDGKAIKITRILDVDELIGEGKISALDELLHSLQRTPQISKRKVQVSTVTSPPSSMTLGSSGQVPVTQVVIKSEPLTEAKISRDTNSLLCPKFEFSPQSLLKRKAKKFKVRKSPDKVKSETISSICAISSSSFPSTADTQLSTVEDMHLDIDSLLSSSSYTPSDCQSSSGVQTSIDIVQLDHTYCQSPPVLPSTFIFSPGAASVTCDLGYDSSDTSDSLSDILDSVIAFELANCKDKLGSKDIVDDELAPCDERVLQEIEDDLRAYCLEFEHNLAELPELPEQLVNSVLESLE
jgi:hypothetical protein